MFSPIPAVLARDGNKTARDASETEQVFLIEVDHKCKTALIQRADRRIEIKKLSDIDLLGTIQLVTEPALVRPV